MPLNSLDNVSFRDPSGVMFFNKGTLLRQVNGSYRHNYDLLMSSGLYDDLAQRGMMVKHAEVSLSLRKTSAAYKVIKPELIPHISYPHEWCFSQFHDAAMLTLDIQKKSLDHGMILKDASAFNIQFKNGRPVFIDTLSFEKYVEGSPWVAYRQFCMHFLAPLALMTYNDIRFNEWFKINVNGVPLDLASNVLPFSTRFKLSLLSHIHLHAKKEKKYSDKIVQVKQGSISKFAMRAIVDSLESALRPLQWHPYGTEWGDYYSDTNYTPETMELKKNIVGKLIGEVKAGRVWDIGANDGTFSRIAAGRGMHTVAFDIDPACVEKNYLRIRSEKESNLLPLLFDITNPSPGIGWANEERMSFSSRGPCDLMMALALIHHIAISNNVPLESIARYFNTLCNHLIIEFVPKKDSQVRRLLATREDIFPEYTQEHFEKSFNRYFTIKKKVPIKDSLRTVYLMKKK